MRPRLAEPVPGPVRWFFVPTADRKGWDLVEARKAPGGWDVRRPGRFGARTYDAVPPPGDDWVEADAPARAPRPPMVQLKPAAPPKKEPTPAPAPRPTANERPDRKAKARHTKPVPTLSREILDLLAKEQLAQPVPKGKAKCPRCGAILEPMKVRKVRTHDDPVTGQRCPASGQPLAKQEL